MTARSLLFVPGNRPDRFAKAATAGADLVLCDLEDAVAPADKDAARAAVAAFVREQGAAVRVNAVGTPWHERDLAALAGAAGLRAIVLPKSEVETATAIAAVVGVELYALVESARGVRDADRLAEVPGVTRLLFGNLDFGLDAGVSPSDATERELLYARSRLVIASRAAGLVAPVDGVCTDLDDAGLVRDSAGRARALGFGGKLCLHPRQVAAVNEAFAPTEKELDWARRVLEAAGESGAAVRVAGEMIDAPRLALARRLLESARSPTVD
ncbi:HpcH/HpaI aldolase/citrate lyase family protein [Amycolatopsis sp. H20-H5]|uniref:HpcH/HpaI aldolase/citrate lyase family protein n=1 Tax=Amycolatopsis sp. H20-H5 TaxID=3046309 RepID=UPI002DB8724D|nr:CoA ester lyase [Amycolatopsis sp. H20-H5]MEC3980714.1 CoA ester lyase [Amycolatopsis sp. H20-H5]